MEVRPGNAEAHRHRLAGTGRHLHRQALALGLGRIEQDRLARVLDQVGKGGGAPDLREVDEGLHRLALAEEEPERLPARPPMVFLEPEAEQALSSLTRTGVAVGAPSVDGGANAVDEMG